MNLLVAYAPNAYIEVRFHGDRARVRKLKSHEPK